MPRITTLSDLPPQAIKRNAKALGIALPSTDERADDEAEQGQESELQSTVEAHLRSLGYWPASDHYISLGVPARGVYYHLHNTKRNPYMLDLLVLDAPSGRFFALELKTKTGRQTPEQRWLARAHGHSALRRSERAARQVLDEFVQRCEATEQ